MCIVSRAIDTEPQTGAAGGNAPTPSVPTRIPITSASLAFSTVAYRRINMRFVRPLSSREDRVAGSYDHTCMSAQHPTGKRSRGEEEISMRAPTEPLPVE